MKPCNVLLVYPAFPRDSFWNIKTTAEVSGAKHHTIPLGLITVAAMLPKEWSCKLVDRNIAALTDADLAWADLVMTGGMSLQRDDALEVVEWAQRLGKPVAIGGPDVSSEPERFRHVDFRVEGEAEGIIAEFIAAWERGERRGAFAAEKFKVDVTTTPIPRFDLLDPRDYMYFSLQFSRGCPFMCEFCDVIELFGRVPRVKSIEQFVAELEALHAWGYRGHLDVVDDNFIGNKKAVKALLPALIAWQERHFYPYWLSTEASLNLAEDDELLGLMKAANFGVIFTGIESPDPATLIAAKKKQNTRRGLGEAVRKIYEYNMFVIGGFVVGFDTESANLAREMIDCVEETAIPVCMVSLLVALPTTQLSKRLAIEGRLYPFSWLEQQAQVQARGGGLDQCTYGLNFETHRPRRAILEDYKRILDEIYEPGRYFARVRRVATLMPTSLTHWVDRFPAERKFLGSAKAEWAIMGRILLSAARDPRTLFHVLREIAWTLRNKPEAMLVVGRAVALYLHVGFFARKVSASIDEQLAAIDQGLWKPPVLRAGAESLGS
ncbi:MAG TPA: DUF4070 domain-containing protein [Reyranella sp.]|nr:DUF4070 domain-containing protein [Reyranella sp.]